MPLPTQIGNSSAKIWRRCGPWQIQGAYYAIILETDDDECGGRYGDSWTVSVYKALDPTAANGPIGGDQDADDLPTSCWVQQDVQLAARLRVHQDRADVLGTIIYVRIWCINVHDYYATFDTTTGRWTLIEPTDLGATDADYLDFAELFIRSNGDVTQSLSQPSAVIQARTTPRTWPTLATFHASTALGLASPERQPTVESARSTTRQATSLLTRSIDGTDTLAAEQTVASDGSNVAGGLAKGAVAYTDAAAGKHCCALYNDSRGGAGVARVSAAYANAEGAAPTWTASRAVSAGSCDPAIFAPMAVDSVPQGQTDYVWAMWADLGTRGGDQDADDPLTAAAKYSHSTNHGSTWAAETLLETQGLGVIALSAQDSIYVGTPTWSGGMLSSRGEFGTTKFPSRARGRRVEVVVKWYHLVSRPIRGSVTANSAND